MSTRLAPLLVATALLGICLASYDAGPAVAAPAKCLGKPATIVGTPGKGVIEGTVHGDVIITGGERHVDAGGGDDLICVTRAGAFVTAGNGDDSVDTSAVRDPTTTRLGTGDDRFIGGSGPDTVYANDGATGDDDQVTTGAGDDEVVAGSAGPTPAARGDMVDLGDGDDVVTVLGSSTGGSYDGGHGHDEIHFTPVDEGEQADWVVDTPKGLATRDGLRAAGFTNIEDFDLSDFLTGSLRLVGGPAAQTVRLDSESRGLSAVDIDLGGGDDTMMLGLATHLSVDGGLGHNTLIVGSDQPSGLRVRVDLAHHQLAYNRLRAVSVTDFADVTAQHVGDVTLLGDDGPNVLTGGRGDDLINGGGGRDTAIGGAGTDHCVAETRIACES